MVVGARGMLEGAITCCIDGELHVAATRDRHRPRQAQRSGNAVGVATLRKRRRRGHAWQRHRGEDRNNSDRGD
jgi:hypothetical protein